MSGESGNGFVKVEKEDVGADKDVGNYNKESKDDCSWCVESQLELQQTIKAIERLQGKKTELEQDMNCCGCRRKHNNNGHEEVGQQHDPANIIIPTTITTSTPINIKVEQVEDEEEKEIPSITIIDLKPPKSNNNNDLEHSVDVDDNKQEVEDPGSQAAVKLEPMSEGEEEKIEEILECQYSSHQVPSSSRPVPAPDPGGFTYKCMKQFKCSAAVSSLSKMTKHLAKVHDWKTYAPFCEVCGHLFMNSNAMKNHRRTKHGPRCKPENGGPELACTECGQRLHRRKLIKHILATHGQYNGNGKQLLWPCPHCKSAMFLNEYDRNVHEQNQHKQECKSCREVFPSEVIRQLHNIVTMSMGMIHLHLQLQA